MKVCCFTVYPAHAPSVFHRVCAYKPLFERADVKLDVVSFLGSELYDIRRQFGLPATLRKLLLFAGACLSLLRKMPSVRRYDLVIIHREVFPLGRPWVEKLIAALSRRCVFDLDDATWHPPSFSVNQRKIFWYGNRVKEMMAACDTVVAGNEYIAEYAREVSDHVVVIPTPYDDLGQLHGREMPRGRPVVVWIGNLGNAEYLDSIYPALQQVALTTPFVLRLIGGADLGELAFAGLEVELITWTREGEAEALATADIGIMPLYDRDYEKGKCAFKLVQYFSAGLPVIASPVGMNREVVREGENGYLATDLDAWVRSLSKLLEGSELRRKMGAAAYADYRECFSREVNARYWLRLLKGEEDGKEAG